MDENAKANRTNIVMQIVPLTSLHLPEALRPVSPAPDSGHSAEDSEMVKPGWERGKKGQVYIPERKEQIKWGHILCPTPRQVGRKEAARPVTGEQ